VIFTMTGCSKLEQGSMLSDSNLKIRQG